jgi:homoserine trans-succinylase
MNVHLAETISNTHEHPSASGRRQHGPDDYLILSELNRKAVVDGLDVDGAPLNLITFGDVREVCPRCKQHLKLVLRQARVRIAHLRCSECDSCFDAHYENGTPALTI